MLARPSDVHMQCWRDLQYSAIINCMPSIDTIPYLGFEESNFGHVETTYSTYSRMGCDIFLLRDNLSKVMALGMTRSLKFISRQMHQTEPLVNINLPLVKS